MPIQPSRYWPTGYWPDDYWQDYPSTSQSLIFERKLYSHLSSSTLISATTTNIYANLLPVNADFPAISFMRVGNRDMTGLSGYTDLENVYLQVDVWGTVYANTKQFANSVLTVMNNAPAFKSVFLSDTDILERQPDGTVIYRVSQDYSCWNRTT